MKTILQSSADTRVGQLLKPASFRRLTYGAGANFFLSIPTGAMNFAVLEFVRYHMGKAVQANPFLAARQEQLGAGMDFASSALSTIACSVVSTPQMMITDNVMAGQYSNLVTAAKGLYNQHGIRGFYGGWWPGLVGKIPSYALTWTLFQQLKQARNRISKRPARNYENSIMGCLASATTVSIMIPMDTIKTRLVTQAGGVAAGKIPYKGIIDCAVRVAKEEGIVAFYRGLPPRLVSVVPMIGIQFGVYEAMKKFMLQRQHDADIVASKREQSQRMAADKEADAEKFEEVIVEVGASHGTGLPVPHMHHHQHLSEKMLKKNQKTMSWPFGWMKR
jgi:solute carrier family 25 S-adenosylmethionine transporter 26